MKGSTIATSPSRSPGMLATLPQQNGQPDPAPAYASRVAAAETDPGTDARGAARIAHERSGQSVEDFEMKSTISHVLRLAASTATGREAETKEGWKERGRRASEIC
ncbi:uncharacterized protein BO97DRAFT_403682 [Aspergillus homomorphus CBS 101889]|uniref:Uncharacterized protein n=1 Tax=Aspergillus homomorphus (strain CBS 101889) TaxID=1450537 RepID=A0A395IA78_ASPHC|nr:hypothetical protein BO97DRAFT_403682 [Aspergillus homomorphus CBS 101889]RAL15054.1 hypothetical protein BO97DRAFT_403682 [Aspergillus homomorphus CBS 101889]